MQNEARVARRRPNSRCYLGVFVPVTRVLQHRILSRAQYSLSQVVEFGQNQQILEAVASYWFGERGGTFIVAVLLVAATSKQQNRRFGHVGTDDLPYGRAQPRLDRMNRRAKPLRGLVGGTADRLRHGDRDLLQYVFDVLSH
jgi:hypothetical protein